MSVEICSENVSVLFEGYEKNTFFVKHRLEF